MKTVQINLSKNKFSNRKLKELDDEDIPVVKETESIEEYEKRTGHGFFGNQTTGYVFKKDTE